MDVQESATQLHMLPVSKASLQCLLQNFLQFPLLHLLALLHLEEQKVSSQVSGGGVVVGGGGGLVGHPPAGQSLGHPSSAPVSDFTQLSTSGSNKSSVRVFTCSSTVVDILTENISIDSGVLTIGAAFSPRSGTNQLEAPEASISYFIILAEYS